MKKPENYQYYTIWSGSLNLGDTPGVFNDSSFVGLMIQMPINITYIPENQLYIEIMLVTNDVEIFNNNFHSCYFDWEAGSSLPSPIGKIDDQQIIPDRPEYHLLKIPIENLSVGNHSITILVNSNTPMGLRDDFVLARIDVDNNSGMKIGNS